MIERSTEPSAGGAPEALLTPVVVGHDGHPHAERVVDAAGEEAERAGAALLLLALVPVVDDPDHTVRAQQRDEKYAVERMTPPARRVARPPAVDSAGRPGERPGARRPGRK